MQQILQFLDKINPSRNYQEWRNNRDMHNVLLPLLRKRMALSREERQALPNPSILDQALLEDDDEDRLDEAVYLDQIKTLCLAGHDTTVSCDLLCLYIS